MSESLARVPPTSWLAGGKEPRQCLLGRNKLANAKSFTASSGTKFQAGLPIQAGLPAASPARESETDPRSRRQRPVVGAVLLQEVTMRRVPAWP